MSLADTTSGELLAVPNMYQNVNQFENGKSTSVGDIQPTTSAVYFTSSETLISTSTQFPNIGNENSILSSPVLSAQLSSKGIDSNPLKRNSASGKS